MAQGTSDYILGVIWITVRIIWIQAFFKGSYSQIILGWILMIVQELSSLGGGLRSPSALVFYLFIFFLGGGGIAFAAA